MGSNSCCTHFNVLQCIFNDFYCCSLLPTQEKSIEIGRYLVSEHLCLWLKNEHEGRSGEEFAPHPGGTNDNDDHACEPNNITVQNKIIAKILPVNKFTTLKICVTPSFKEWVFFSWLLCFALQYMFIQIGSQTWASLPFVPPSWSANSSQGCRSCSFSGHKQRCWTVLSGLRYKVAYNQLYQLKSIPEISVKNISKIFY